MPKASKHDCKDSAYTIICRVLLGLLVITTLCLIPTDKSDAAPQVPPKRILFIPSYNAEYKGCKWFFHSLMAKFEEQKPFKTIFLTENLELSAHPTDIKYWERMAASLKIKYADEKPDLIIVQYRQALSFMTSYGKEIFGDVPVLFAGLSVEGYENEQIPNKYIGITASYSAKKNVELILRNHPKIKKIYVVGGTSPVEKYMVNAVINEGPPYSGKVEFIPLTDLTFPELLTKIGTLGDDSVVMYQALQLDAAGNVFVPAQAAVEIAKASRVPVYGMLDTYKGSGIIGGFLVDHELLGNRAAEIAMNLLKSGAAPDKQITTEPIGSYIFDARQLKRRGIAEDKLPSGSHIDFKTFSIWDTYWKEILAAASLIILQAILIAGLLWNRRIRLRAEESMRASEESNRIILQSAMDGFWLISADKSILNVNDAYCQMSGYSRQELVGMHIKELEAIDSEEVIVGRGKRIVDCGGDLFESQHRRKDGSIFHVGVSIKYLPLDGGQFAVFVRDITERKLAEIELQQSKAMLQAAMDCSPAGIAIADAPDGKLRYVNDAGLLIRGGDRQSVVNGVGADQYVASWKILDLDGRPLRTDEVPLARAIMFGETSNREFIIRRSEGDDHIVLANAAPIKDEFGNVKAGIVVFTDITEQKLAEIAIKQSEADLRLMAESMPQIVWITRPDGWTIYFNQHWMDYTGLSLEESLGHGWNKPFHPDDQQKAWIAWENATRNLGTYSIECRLRRADGEYKWWLIRGVPVLDQQGTILKWFGTCTDIDEFKMAEGAKHALEQQLHQAQKMESVGSLAGGVAHDFNNKLSVILGCTYMAFTESDPVQLKNYLEEIRKAAEQSADLTRQLLAFARKQTIAPKVLDLNETVTGMLKMLNRLIGEDIRLTWQPAPDLWLLKFDPSQVDQILANLCVNARDSITIDGKITIETGNIVIDDDYCANHSETLPGEYVRLVVSDNGCGMDNETLNRIFEPFFTTKETGKGTGLGLATVFGIVKQNNGFINVYSEQGIGTTFTIYLPRHLGKNTQAENKSMATPAPVGQETILLVEDELAILNIASIILGKQGYTVLSANSPAEAIRLAKENAGEINLLISDVIMPDMNGKELSNILQSLYPQLKSLYMSGYTADAIALHGVLDDGVNFIQKPFSLPDLAVKVRAVIDGK